MQPIDASRQQSLQAAGKVAMELVKASLSDFRKEFSDSKLSMTQNLTRLLMKSKASCKENKN